MGQLKRADSNSSKQHVQLILPHVQGVVAHRCGQFGFYSHQNLTRKSASCKVIEGVGVQV